jgi:hypothetical protein
MEISAYQSPLSAEGLQELGRLAVNFGHAEWMLDWFVAGAAGVRQGPGVPLLVSPLATRRKIEVLESCLNRLPTNVQAFLTEACGLIEQANGIRNDVLHGFWVFSRDESAPISMSGKKPGKRRLTEEITIAADKVAVATRLLHAAMIVADGGDVSRIRYPVSLTSGMGEPG